MIALFTDIVHVTSEGRQMMADRLQTEIFEMHRTRTGASY